MIYPKQLFVCLLFLPLGLCAQKKQYHAGIDSVNNISWWEQPVGLGMTAKIQKQLVQSEYIVVLHCDSSFYYEQFIGTPKSCLNQLERKNKQLGVDSAGHWYFQCVRDYYKGPGKSKVDTLYADGYFDDSHMPGMTWEESAYFVTQLELYDEDSTYHATTKFYTLDELENTCYTGSYFRYKSVDVWQDGKKDETWKYFDKSGKLIHKITYKKGELIKEERF